MGITIRLTPARYSETLRAMESVFWAIMLIQTLAMAVCLGAVGYQLSHYKNFVETCRQDMIGNRQAIADIHKVHTDLANSYGTLADKVQAHEFRIQGTKIHG